MIQLEFQAKLILTDSGGVQKEAFFAHVPCITMRDETEWTETVTYGANQLVGADTNRILEAVTNIIVDFSTMPSVFGDGNTAEKLVAIMKQSL
jgi:UDP-GlcNAc3NAcA epimerase